MFGYQRRALAWMYQRETGTIENISILDHREAEHKDAIKIRGSGDDLGVRMTKRTSTANDTRDNLDLKSGLHEKLQCIEEDDKMVDAITFDEFNPLWEKLVTHNNTRVHHCSAFGTLCNDKPPPLVMPNGGILADEMGLGKTVEMIALFLLRPAPSQAHFSPVLAVKKEYEGRKT